MACKSGRAPGMTERVGTVATVDNFERVSTREDDLRGAKHPELCRWQFGLHGLAPANTRVSAVSA
jgi:hypothetical protein